MSTDELRDLIAGARNAYFRDPITASPTLRHTQTAGAMRWVPPEHDPNMDPEVPA